VSDPSEREWRVTTQLSGGFPAGGFPVPWRPDYALPRQWHSTLDGEGLPYIVELDFAADEAGPSCQALRLVAREAGEPVSARRLREVPVAECIQVAISSAAMRFERRAGELRVAIGGTDPADTMELARKVRPRSATTSDEHLREVADVYLKAPEKPTRAVEDAFGPISHSTAARWVGEARRRGFIPPIKRGRTSARRKKQ
jgi:hypothetical protein